MDTSSSEEDPYLNLSDDDPEFLPQKKKPKNIDLKIKADSLPTIQKSDEGGPSWSSAVVSSQDDLTEPSDSKPSVLENFFEIKHLGTDKNKTEGKCLLCQPITKLIKGYKNTTTNYLKHIRRKHPGQLEKYEALKKEISAKIQGKSNMSEVARQNTSDQKSQKVGYQRTTQSSFDTKIINFVIDTISPISILENKSFISLFEDMPYHIMSRKTAIKRISELFSKQVQLLISKLKSVDYICTTADIWSAKRRSFMGITIHWIDNDFSRKSAALSCKRIKGTHDYQKIAEHLENINLKFGLDQSKIVATVTDNASNFVKAFKEFGNDPDISYMSKKNDAEENSSSDDTEIEELDLDRNELRHVLPNHVRCASHTLNLIATTDCQNAIRSNIILRTRHMHALDKCTQLWKKSGKPKTSEIIEEIVGHSFSYPGQTRWNSTYDSIVQILKEKSKLPFLFEKLEIPYFKETELNYLEEYVEVMAPLASTLDFLQGQENTFYGYVLPSIISLKNKLLKLQSTDLKYGGELLLKATIHGLDKRFLPYLTLEDENAVVASVLCPNIKFRWFGCINNPKMSTDDIKKIIIQAATEVETQSFNEDSSPEEDFGDYFFEFNESSEEKSKKRSEVGVECGKTYARVIYTKIELEFMKYLDDKRKNLNMLNDFKFLKPLFIKYNTCLPSSAPVERMFSFASIINAPRRHSLSDENFEKLVLLKANNTSMVLREL